MQLRHDRIRRAQELMAQHKMIGIMIMNPDDYRYFFSEVRSQPRAIIPASGSPGNNPPVWLGDYFATVSPG